MPHTKPPMKKLLSKRIILYYILPIVLLASGIAFGIHKYLEYHRTQEEKQYLTIKEMGVRFKLPPSLRGDIEYRARVTDASTIDVAFFSKSLAAKTQNCSKHSYGAGIGVVLYRDDKAHIAASVSGHKYIVGDTKAMGHFACYLHERNDSDPIRSQALKKGNELAEALKKPNALEASR